MSDAQPDSLICHPIGVLHTTMQSKFAAPHQPSDPFARQGTIELFNGSNFEAALSDLQGFDQIWLIWWFHRNKHWRPKVLPPRGAAIKRGVFATRSPHRPNPIGLTAVRLLEIKGRTLHIGECDLVDGTPILDIKPYLPQVDSFPEAKIGWLTSVVAGENLTKDYQVRISERAAIQRQWLANNWQIEFLERAIFLLERDPSPHRSRRIVSLRNGEYRISCGAWRAFYSLNLSQRVVEIHSLAPGYPEQRIRNESAILPDGAAQLGFLQEFG